MDNFLKLGYTEDGQFVYYAFLDTVDVLSTVTVSDHLIRFEDLAILGRENEKYKMIVAKILSEAEEEFEAAMTEFRDIMMFKGYRDYARQSARLIRELAYRVNLDISMGERVFTPNGDEFFPEKCQQTVKEKAGE
ncbi:MAG: hypothetical protein IKG87_14775 [Clostridia bacterium]|nr:hypothetical protein [Clostridia bacterium]